MLRIRSLAALVICSGLLISTAPAQVSGGNTMTCAVNVAAPPTIRAEGFTEKAGEITLSCTGGTPAPLSTPVPAANIQVFLNAAVTSRIYPNGLSEAMLIID